MKNNIFKPFLIFMLITLLTLGCSAKSDSNKVDEEPSNEPVSDEIPSSKTPSKKSEEYKPANKMTQDEIEKELEEIIDKGPAMSPENYDSGGNHKPVEEMTQDEIKEELLEIMGEGLDN